MSAGVSVASDRKKPITQTKKMTRKMWRDMRGRNNEDGGDDWRKEEGRKERG